MTTRHDHLIERAAARLNQDDDAMLAGCLPPLAASPNGGRTDEGAVPARHGEAGPAVAAQAAGGLAGLAAAADGELPELSLSALELAGLVVGRSTRTRISEEFRIAVARVARMAEQPGAAGGVRSPLILVTSAKPGEGKSFTSLNLAAVLAQHGPRRVVLVDTDFKQDSISGLLGLANRRGLLDVLAPGMDVRSLLVTTAVPRLHVLPGGLYRQDDLAAGFSRPLGPRVAALADALPDCNLVLDAPPTLSTSDASTLAGQAGQVLLVVEAGRTQRAEVEAALDFVRACPTVAMLLNKTRQSSRRTFGSYDYLSNYQ